jgi:hypothetical protein
MQIQSLLDLKAVVALCRKAGVTSIEVDGIKLVLGDAPAKRQHTRTERLTHEAQLQPPTEEQLLMWSVRDSDTAEAV